MTDNVKLIQAVYAAFAKGNIDPILARVSDDADWRGPRSKELPYGGNCKRAPGAAKFFDNIASALRVTA